MIKKQQLLKFLIVFACILLVIFGAYWFYHIEQTMQRLEKDVEMFKQQVQVVEPTEFTQALDFLENETTKYRRFVENQQDFLLWIMGVIGVGLTGLFTFFEIKGRKDIKKIIQEQYKDQVEKEMAGFIGGSQKLAYLKNCVEKEEQAKRKKILFVVQNEENKNLDEVYKILEEQEYSVEKKKLREKKIKDREICKLVEECDIIIYQTDKSESEVPDENVAYARIARKCNDEKVFCILYCEGRLNRELYKDLFYINNANYGLTVMERIFNLLYFM